MYGRLGRARMAVLAASLLATAAVPGAVAAAGPLCVGGSGCYDSVQAAVDAAHDGDVIKINPGTYAGGVTVTASVRLIGAGAAITRIKGGGPVLTIGTYGADTEPTVVIEGLSITGGVTRTSAQSTDWVGEPGVIALGGGIEIPPNADYSGGATVIIKDSSITGNRVAPSTTAPVGPPCPDGPCPFALASGGGIDSWGTLTLVRTTVSNNSVGAASGLSDLASDAEGAGIRSWIAPLTIQGSRINGNRASAVAPNGRFADSGGIFVNAGSFEMDHSSVSGNRAVLAAALPDSVDLGAHAGGIHLADDVDHATITDSIISGNTVTMTNSVGSADAFSGGLHVDWGVQPFTMTDSVVAYNRVSVRTLAGSAGDASGDSGAGEMHGTIDGTRFIGNTVDIRSAAGNAYALAGVSIFTGTISHGTLAGNKITASSPGGDAWTGGGALMADEGGITLRETAVRDNIAHVSGHDSATAQGGGIYDSPIPDGPPGGPLMLDHSSVTGNVLTGSAGATLQGGGVYATDVPVTITSSVVRHNVPDECFGC
jgi:hypothetical protein